VVSKPDLESVPEIQEAIAAAEGALNGRGRILVRYSGTESLCRVMVEGPTLEITDRWAEEVAQVVRSVLGK
jgi:phosphoglucosamine mutase